MVDWKLFKDNRSVSILITSNKLYSFLNHISMKPVGVDLSFLHLYVYMYIYKVLISVCPIITKEPLDRFASYFDWVTGES